MIVSASYRTDIPAFYGEWFRNRLRAGHCKTVNPYGGQIATVALTPEAVDGFVFWTRNAEPFMDGLAAVRRLGIAFMVQYTVTGYPRALEPAVTPAAQAVGVMRRLVREFGPGAVVWRYDPVLVTSLTPPEWHLATFARLAAALEGVVDEVVISFAHAYVKTRRNLAAAARAYGFDWHDPDAAWKRATAARLAEIAAAHGMALTLCAQPDYVAGAAGEACCIDAGRLSRVAGQPLSAVRKGNRPGCRCYASRDIGAYDSCPHGCVYCYAVRHRALAKQRFKAHDPDSEFLFPPLPAAIPPTSAPPAALGQA